MQRQYHSNDDADGWGSDFDDDDEHCNETGSNNVQNSLTENSYYEENFNGNNNINSEKEHTLTKNRFSTNENVFFTGKCPVPSSRNTSSSDNTISSRQFDSGKGNESGSNNHEQFSSIRNNPFMQNRQQVIPDKPPPIQKRPPPMQNRPLPIQSNTQPAPNKPTPLQKRPPLKQSRGPPVLPVKTKTLPVTHNKPLPVRENPPDHTFDSDNDYEIHEKDSKNKIPPNAEQFFKGLNKLQTKSMKNNTCHVSSTDVDLDDDNVYEVSDCTPNNEVKNSLQSSSKINSNNVPYSAKPLPIMPMPQLPISASIITTNPTGTSFQSLNKTNNTSNLIAQLNQRNPGNLNSSTSGYSMQVSEENYEVLESESNVQSGVVNANGGYCLNHNEFDDDDYLYPVESSEPPKRHPVSNPMMEEMIQRTLYNKAGSKEQVPSFVNSLERTLVDPGKAKNSSVNSIVEPISNQTTSNFSPDSKPSLPTRGKHRTLPQSLMETSPRPAESHAKPSLPLSRQGSTSSNVMPLISPSIESKQNEVAAQDLTTPKLKINMTNPSTSIREVKSCIALYSYDGVSVEGGVSFSEGDIITILDDSNPDWFYGSANQKTGHFPKNYVQIIETSQPQTNTAKRSSQVKPPSDISHFSWYGGHMDRKAAELQLTHKNKEGYFIIRETDKGAGYSISIFCEGATTHLRVPFKDGGYFLGDSGKEKFSSVEEMIRHHTTNQVNLKSGVKPYLYFD